MQNQSGQSQSSGRGNPQNEVIQITKHLKGIDFPASKDDLVDCAERNGADEDVLEAIRALPRDNFESITEVTAAESKGSRGGRNGDDEDLQ